MRSHLHNTGMPEDVFPLAVRLLTEQNDWLVWVWDTDLSLTETAETKNMK